MPTPRPSMKKLDFTEKLIQSGKKETTDALLKRLKTLHLKLKSLEQDTTDVKSLNQVRTPLIDPIIMHHKDRGVKAYAACCLADLLRLYAPDAPFSQEELRDIFQFMSTQISTNLKVSSTAVKPLQPSRSRSGNIDASQTQLLASITNAASQRITDAAYYNEYYYLLENLATIRSVVLATDVPDGDEIVTSFFEGFVDIVRSDMSKNLIRHMYDILAVLIEEAQSIPSGVMDVIISQFEGQKDKETRNSTAFLLIQNVCNRTSQKLHRAIYAHFSAIQLEHGRSQSAASSFETLAESHDLIIIMHKHCPGLLDGFIAQLEENLRAADEVPLRQLSTRTLGTMFGTRPVVGGRAKDLAEAYPGAWTAWLGRKVDKALPVRLAWVESARGVLVGQPDLRKIMEREMIDRVQDAEEKVRAALCRVFGQLDYETALHHIDVQSLQAIGNRASDKKASVRVEATSTLCKLWNLAYPAIEAGDQASIAQFAWIPSSLLAALTRRDVTVELRSQITSVFKAQILPLPAVDQIDEQAWTDRLLVVYCHLDEGGRRALERLTGLKGYSRGNSPFRAFIDFCETNNGGVIEHDEKLVRARLDYVITAMSRQLFADPARAKLDLEKFADINEQRLYKLIKGCVDPQSDLRQIVKAKNELLRRIEQGHTDILDTFITFIDNAAWNVLNHSSIPALIKRLQRPESSSAASADAPMSPARAAYELLGLISKECPPMYKSHIAELVIIMADKKNELLSEAGLRALASVCKADPESAPADKRANERALQKAIEGTPKQAKFATRFLAYGKQPETCAQLLEDVMKALQSGRDKNLLAHLRVLSELTLSSPQVLEQKASEVSTFLREGILDKESPIEENDTDAEWTPETELDTLDRAKLLALRIFTHRALAHARSSDALVLADEVFVLLRSALVGKEEDEMLDDDAGSSRASHHMKLRAALCLLKLANAKIFDKHMSWELFETVASVCQAAVFQVRNKFLLKLGEILPLQRLLPRWNVLPVLAALDPDPENVQVAASVLQQIVRGAQSLPTEQRIDRIELQLSRLLLVLSHHPDLEMSEDMVKSFARYIELFIDCFATRENISLILHIAAKVKTVRDPMRDDSENLYCLAELAQIIIKNRANQHGWPLQSYPGKIRLPRDGFLNLHDPKQVSDNVRRTYLKEEVLGWVKTLGKRGAVNAVPRERKPATQRTRVSVSPGAKKRRAANKKSQAAKKRRRRDEEDDEDDEESEEEYEDDEEDEGEDEDMDVEEAESSALSEEEGEQVVGRGGRRGAKSKAKKAVARGSKKTKTPKKGKKGTDESELSDDE